MDRGRRLRSGSTHRDKEATTTQQREFIALNYRVMFTILKDESESVGVRLRERVCVGVFEMSGFMKSSELENQKSREFGFETTPPSVVLTSPHGLIGVHVHDFLSSSGFRFIENRQLFTKLHAVLKKFPEKRIFSLTHARFKQKFRSTIKKRYLIIEHVKRKR